MQHPFELDDPIDRLVQLGEGDPTEGAVEDRSGVPRPEEDPDPTPGRQRPPEPPHRRPLPLLVGGLPHGVGLDAARIQPLQQEVHRLGLARAADARHDHDDREVGLGQLPLRLEQGRAEPGASRA